MDQENLIRNAKGSTVFTFILWIQALVIFQSLIIGILNIRHQQIRHRSKQLLCFKKQTVLTSNYLKNMARFNFAIRAAKLASLAPVPAAKFATAIFKGLKIAQQLYHYSFLKKSLSNPYCSLFFRGLHIKGNIYKTTPVGTLKRGPDGVPKIRKKTWKIIIPLNRSKSQWAKTDLSINSRFKRKRTIKTTISTNKAMDWLHSLF